MDKDERLQAYRLVERENSTATILFHSAIANHFGQNLTDWICASMIQQKGTHSAGQLAELTGLTTGAITGLIDRLEKAGVVQRQPDPNDRRRVIVAVQSDWEDKMTPFYTSILELFAEITAVYSDEELALIIDFNKRTAAMMEEEAIKIRTGNAAYLQDV